MFPVHKYKTVEFKKTQDILVGYAIMPTSKL